MKKKHKATDGPKLSEEIDLARSKLLADQANYLPPTPEIKEEPFLEYDHFDDSYAVVDRPKSETDILIVLSGIAMAAGFVALGMALR